MAETNTTAKLQRAGDIEILEATLISEQNPFQSRTNVASPTSVDIRLYIGELNLFEDMYSPGIYGNLLMLDAANLIGAMKLVGTEWLTLKLRTPTMEDKTSLIYKTFKVYSITDRQMISDTGKQSYILHFCSPELMIDSMTPQFSTFRGSIQKVVGDIFVNNIATQRVYDSKDGVKTPLIILGPTQNEVTFTSPGWKPIQCINWLASKTIGVNYKNPGYLFYESNKAFYFANVEALIDNAIQTKQVYQEYTYVAKKLTADQDPGKDYVKDVNIDYQKVEDMQIIENINYFKNLQNGYYANRLFTLDVVTKQYNAGFDYNHTARFFDYKHLEQIGGGDIKQPFALNDASLQSPGAHMNFYPKHTGLYTEQQQNVSDVIEQTMPKRISNLNELSNFKVEITVPGRTDIEVGVIVHYFYPDASPRDESDKFKLKADSVYTGYYLVTAIRHKITLQSHVMILEMVKDSTKVWRT